LHNSRKRCIRWFLLSRVGQKLLLSQSVQLAQANLSLEQVSSTLVPYIEFSEQEQIAKILDTVDRAIAQTETLIAKYKRVKTGLMQDLLTRGIDENGQLRDPRTHKFKRSPLGMIPDQWEVTTLDKVCINIVDCPHSTPHFIEEGVLIARTPQIKDGSFYINDASFVNEIEYKQRISRLEPKAGDIIFTREAPVGEAFIIPYNMKICLGQRTMLLRLNQKCIVAEYLLLQIYSNSIRSQIDQLVGGTTTPHLNVMDVGKFCFPLPKINEQQIMKNILDAQELTIKTKKAHLHKLQKIKTGLMQDLLTGKTSVKPLLTNQA
jgi:type I restriction enzyme, S subunit